MSYSDDSIIEEASINEPQVMDGEDNYIIGDEDQSQNICVIIFATIAFILQHRE